MNIRADIVISAPDDVAHTHMTGEIPVIVMGDLTVIVSALSLTVEQRIAWLRSHAAAVSALADAVEALAVAEVAL